MPVIARAFATAALVLQISVLAPAQTSQTLSLRGHDQLLRIYGVSTGEPVIVSSGDGGWTHLSPHIAETLSQRGFYVVGFDVRAYLTSFTAGQKALDVQQEPGDYAVLADFAERAAGKKPLLIGVSEGAGLSLLAATDPPTQAKISGVIGVGLPDINELGWRWKDAVIYVTHKVPNEPTFSTAEIAARVSPIPLAAIHSTGDEFVKLADTRRVIDNAREPKRLWVINASNHRFSDNLTGFDARLMDAIEWIRQSTPHR
jgi:pimeloyl-ACP methyl ester carboxylesterase